jgi:hypothetical protein
MLLFTKPDPAHTPLSFSLHRKVCLTNIAADCVGIVSYFLLGPKLTFLI